MPCIGELTLQQIPFTHLMHFTMMPGATNILMIIIKAGCLPLPYRIEQLAMSIYPAPGGAASVSFTLSNGVDSMTVVCTGAETGKANTTGFDVDPVTQDLTLHYTEDPAVASWKAAIAICRRYT